MTEKQIEKAKDELYFKYYGDECRVPQNLKQPWSKKDKVLEEELDCREMINSMLIYGNSTDEGSYGYKKYLEPYTKKGTWHDGLISTARLSILIAEQKESFSKATVHHNVYTDCEGCTYNSCDWGD